MSRPLRIQYSGAWYHVMNRGRRREAIFPKKEDYIAFVEVLKESVSLWNIKISAYCLMPNHYHLLLQTPEGNLSRCMRHINGVYTQRYNRRNRHDGQLFRGRYKSILLDSDNYLTVLVRYIHRNPLRAKMVNRLEDYAWSSHNGYLSKSSKWHWLNKEAFFQSLTDDKSKRLREYKEFIDEEDSKEVVTIFSKRKAPSVLGTEEFVNWVKEKYSALSFKEEIPESKALIPDKEKIRFTVCKAYKVDIASLYGIRRGIINKPRNVAIYLTRCLRRDSLKEIGKEFKVPNYSSVSSIIESMKANLAGNKKLRKQVDKIKRDLQLSHKQT
ncbi:MAG: Chromosomal replication initiator protein DnaA [Candidatus Scalindua arabica]|uniref:Chromosomal replication initiator protein DnaA n=1 Tax=Candidatus Scalindua arabica TaxID=1127984 RepID=A0A941W286_9BACT|nr:Chromosomal replication initiator protein DnaA [Candidatus Scalindua arabica]